MRPQVTGCLECRYIFFHTWIIRDVHPTKTSPGSFVYPGLRVEVFGFTEGCIAGALAEPQGGPVERVCCFFDVHLNVIGF